MVPDSLQRLLILQERDSRCGLIQRQLEDIPHEISREEERMQQLDEDLKKQEGELKQMEVRRLDLEGEVEQIEANLVKYKTQQMQVKKNEEYIALENEIKGLEDRISETEDQVLQLMEAIETRQSALEDMRTKTTEEKRILQTHVERLKANFISFEGELEDARQAVVDCEAEIEAANLQEYRYVKSQLKRPPVVVALQSGRCEGCHLKVSGEIDSLVRKSASLVRCDNCGRILYLDR